jgi:hypothetical protein
MLRAAFITGEWGGMQGLLAVALKAPSYCSCESTHCAVTEVGQLPQLDGGYGRLRTVRAEATPRCKSRRATTTTKALRIAPLGT